MASEIRAHAVSADEVPGRAQQLLARSQPHQQQQQQQAHQAQQRGGMTRGASGQSAFAALKIDDDAESEGDYETDSGDQAQDGGSTPGADSSGSRAALQGKGKAGKSRDDQEGSQSDPVDDADKKKKKKKKKKNSKKKAGQEAEAGAAAAAVPGSAPSAAAVWQQLQKKEREKSGTLSALLDSALFPQEVANLFYYKFGGGEKKLFPQLDLSKETPSMQRCYYFLTMTSRSFAPVIKALHPKLRPAICVFYLVLRGLDTVEDDMSINLARKRQVLEQFHTHLFEPGWNFTESGPNEKDRQLLVEFGVVISEFSHLETKYSSVIADICKRMGAGMSRFADQRVLTIEDYNQYCHYVAGLVGIGLARLFAASGLEAEEVGRDLDLANSMGLFLQKTNIIRDYLEDLEDGRTWYPKEIWSLYAKDLADLADPKNLPQALRCLNHMIADALNHVPDVFTFMSRIKEQSVFNFCAIPQVMAVATLVLCYNNPNVFKTNVKIRKGLAVTLMLRAQNMDNLYDIFAECLSELWAKASGRDDKITHRLNAIHGILLQRRPEAAAIMARPPTTGPSMWPIYLALAAGAGAAYYFGAHRRIKLWQ